MINYFEGSLNQSGTAKVAIINSRFNSFICERLQEGAIDALKRHGIADEQISVYKVPGAFEIPLLARKLADSKKYDGIVCLGAVIRGDTPHFDYVAAEVSKGIATTSIDSGVPIAFGILTTNTIEQAIERAGSKAGNKGWDATVTLLEMIDLLNQI